MGGSLIPLLLKANDSYFYLLPRQRKNNGGSEAKSRKIFGATLFPCKGNALLE